MVVYQIVTNMSDLIGTWLGVVAGSWRGRGRETILPPAIHSEGTMRNKLIVA